MKREVFRESLDSIEAIYNEVELFIEYDLRGIGKKREERTNVVSRSYLSGVKITNTHVCIPIYGVTEFTKVHKRCFKKRFPNGKICELDGIYWIETERKRMGGGGEEDVTESFSSRKK